MRFSDWMFVLAAIASTIAVLALVWGRLTRPPPRADGDVIGDAALLDHPQLPRPPAKPAPREPEPMGA